MIQRQRKCITPKRSYVVSLHNREQEIRKFKIDSELLPHFGFCSNFKKVWRFVYLDLLDLGQHKQNYYYYYYYYYYKWQTTDRAIWGVNIIWTMPDRNKCGRTLGKAKTIFPAPISGGQKEGQDCQSAEKLLWYTALLDGRMI